MMKLKIQLDAWGIVSKCEYYLIDEITDGGKCHSLAAAA